MTLRKRPPIAVWLIPLLVGVSGICKVAKNPNFTAYRVVDVVQLLGSGVCFGVVIAGLIFMLRVNRP